MVDYFFSVFQTRRRMLLSILYRQRVCSELAKQVLQMFSLSSTNILAKRRGKPGLFGIQNHAELV